MNVEFIKTSLVIGDKIRLHYIIWEVTDIRRERRTKPWSKGDAEIDFPVLRMKQLTQANGKPKDKTVYKELAIRYNGQYKWKYTAEAANEEIQNAEAAITRAQEYLDCVKLRKKTVFG